MMKKLFGMVGVLVLLLANPDARTEAGTFVAGAKLWYETTWDSAVLDIYDQQITDMIENVGYYNVTSDTHSGSGYLAGPVLGYQTSDNVWSISLAPMVFSNFSQKINGSAIADLDIMPSPVDVLTDSSVDVTRTDLDIAVSYSFLQFKERLPILEYCKLFIGFKYENVEYDFDFTMRRTTFSEITHFEFDYEVYMPTGGIGFVYPFTDDIAADIQGGIGMAFFEGLNVDDGFAYNFEANVNIVPIDNMIIQFGYRYQAFAFDYQGQDNRQKYKSTDRTYGPTATLIYTF